MTATDLEQHIRATPLIDTHEHMNTETEYVENGPDVLQSLFQNYVQDDLASAGAAPEAIKRLHDAGDPDIAGRFRGIEDAWQKCRLTGYGEAVRLIARQVYGGMDEITVKGIEAAAERNRLLRRPGERLRLLKDVANLDHIQTDNFSWACLPDPSGPDFFLFDINWFGFCNGHINPAELHGETDVEVRDLETLRGHCGAVQQVRPVRHRRESAARVRPDAAMAGAQRCRCGAGAGKTVSGGRR